MGTTTVSVADEIPVIFQGFKIGVEKELSGLIYKIDDSKTIVTDQKLLKPISWENIVGALPADEPRYLLVDFHFESNDGSPTSRFIFIAWDPESASIKQRFLYSGSKDQIKDALAGVGIHVNAQNTTDLDKQKITDIARQFA